MQVLFLGAGGMGAAAARAATTIGGITAFTVADRDLERAQALADELKAATSVAVRARAVDVTDLEGLATAFKGIDVVMNATGPFFRFGVPILRTAISSRVNYVDICDDWEPTLEMLDLDAEAKAAGVTALVGMGMSPGSLNLLAMLAARELDEIDDLHTCWGVDAAEEGKSGAEKAPTSAALVHWVHQLSRDIRTAEAGQLIVDQPMRELRIDYPGIAEGSVYSVGHPEPVTLVRRLAIKGRSINAMVMPRRMLAVLETLREDIAAGRLTVSQAADAINELDEARLARAEKHLASLRGVNGLPRFFAYATGRRQGRPVRIGVTMNSLPRGMAKATGVPMALGLQRLIDKGAAVGVHAPESVVDPDWFFDQLAPRCDPPLPDGAALIRIDRAD